MTSKTWSHIPHKPVFLDGEFHGRLDRVRASMADRGVEAMVVTNPSNLFYLTGYDTLALHDFMAVIVTQVEEPAVIINEFHEGLYRSLSGMWAVHCYSEFDDPIDTATALLRKASPTVVTLDAEWRERTDRLRDRLSAAMEFVPSFGVIESVRMVKSEAEIELMRRVAAVTDAGARAAMQSLAAGVVDHEIASAAMAAQLAAGGEFPATCPIVCGGYRGGIPYSTFDGYRLKEGDVLFVEQTGSIRRYSAPLMRTAVLGTPSDEVRRAAEATSAATKAILRTACEGVNSRTVAEAALSELQPALSGKAFHNIIGYPVGIAYPPTWVESLGQSITVQSDFTLRAGMVFHLPMSLRKPGEWAVGLSQTIVIGEEQSEALSGTEAKLFYA